MSTQLSISFQFNQLINHNNAICFQLSCFDYAHFHQRISKSFGKSKIMQIICSASANCLNVGTDHRYRNVLQCIFNGIKLGLKKINNFRKDYKSPKEVTLGSPKVKPVSYNNSSCLLNTIMSIIYVNKKVLDGGANRMWYLDNWCYQANMHESKST